MYDLKQIEIFLVAAEQLNFHKAAEQLNTTQPSVSKAISSLEHQLKRKLFNRTTRNICLTEEGVEFYSQSLSLLEKIRELSQKTFKCVNSKEKALKIGTSAAAFVNILPKIVHNFQEHHSDSVQIEFEQLNTGECIEKLVNKDLDIGIIILPASHKKLEIKSIYTGCLKLAVSKYHPYACKKRLPLAMFGKDTFIMHAQKESTHMYSEIMECFKESGVKPKIREAKPNENCMGMVVANIGVHFVSQEAENIFVQHELSCIEVYPSPPLKLGIAWHKDNPNLLTQTFVNEACFYARTNFSRSLT